jgi:hypothetical protein
MIETTIGWVLQQYPDRVKALLNALDLDRTGSPPGAGTVKKPRCRNLASRTQGAFLVI